MAANDDAAGERVEKRHPFLFTALEFGTITIILLLVIRLFRAFQPGFMSEVEMLSFAWLQRALPEKRVEDRLDVVVVDISQLKAINGVTPRKDLEPLIGAIADAQPSAIAVDIDFSPNRTIRDPGADADFFDFCESLYNRRPPVPIFLGVESARDDGPDAWLETTRYSNMAVAGRLQIDEESPEHVTNRVLAQYTPQKGSHSTVPLHTMAYALAKAFISNKKARGESWPSDSRGWASVILEPVVPDEEALKDGVGSLINYSKLRQLSRERLLTVSKQSATEFSEFFSNRMVVLGDVHAPSSEDFLPPGQPVMAKVFGHAIGAYTLAIQPVYEFRWFSRIAMDVMVSLPLFYLILRRAKVDAKDDANAKSRLTMASWFCAFAVLIVGFVLVGFVRIIWLDFVVTAVGLVLHPVVHHWLGKSFGVVANWLWALPSKLPFLGRKKERSADAASNVQTAAATPITNPTQENGNPKQSGGGQ